VKRYKHWRELIPAWDMPSDPVKAVWWFLHWLLKVLVNFFWLPIVGMIIYETIINGRVGGVFNGIVSGIVTLLIGLVVWGVLYVLMAAIKVGTGISHVVGDIKRVQQQQNDFLHQTYEQPMHNSRSGREERVVEGSITDLDEERQKRRSE
jgi:hypothetical protein